MRIVSLVPSATETLFALERGDELVAVTHECDHPLEALELPRITRDLLGPGLDAAEVDRAVREHSDAGRSIYELDRGRLQTLKPDLIVTQALCDVCAISYEDVRAVAGEMDPVPEVISLDPRTLGEVLGTVRRLAEATDAEDAGDELIEEAAARIDHVRMAVAGADRPRVVVLEWLDPLYVAGHWTPQLVDYAGGEDVLGLPGEHSERADWELVAALAPDVVIVAPCGYDAERAREEAESHADRLASLGAGRVVALDANAYLSRPGPRLVDGLETLAHALHPDRVPESPGAVLPVHVTD